MKTIEVLDMHPFTCSKKWRNDIETIKMLVSITKALETVSNESHCLKISLTEQDLGDNESINLVLHFEHLSIDELNLLIPTESIKLKDMRYVNRGALVGLKFISWLKEKETIAFKNWLFSVENVICEYFGDSSYVRFRIEDWPDKAYGRLSDIRIDLLGIEISTYQ